MLVKGEDHRVKVEDHRAEQNIVGKVGMIMMLFPNKDFKPAPFEKEGKCDKNHEMEWMTTKPKEYEDRRFHKKEEAKCAHIFHQG